MNEWKIENRWMGENQLQKNGAIEDRKRGKTKYKRKEKKKNEKERNIRGKKNGEIHITKEGMKETKI
jgi:hypothetical protein